eukprot:846125-Amorphochlora_amoeboformis.AAC.1
MVKKSITVTKTSTIPHAFRKSRINVIKTTLILNPTLAMEIPGFEGNTRGSKNAVERESRDARLGVYSDPVLDALGWFKFSL